MVAITPRSGSHSSPSRQQPLARLSVDLYHVSSETMPTANIHRPGTCRWSKIVTKRASASAVGMHRDVCPLNSFCSFFQHLGACRQQTPRIHVDYKVPEDVPCQNLFDATLILIQFSVFAISRNCLTITSVLWPTSPPTVAHWIAHACTKVCFASARCRRRSWCGPS